jgi:CNP1-like family
MKFEKRIPGVVLAVLTFGLSALSPANAGFEEEYEKQAWQELEHQLPAAPKKESLLPFYVSAATDNLFFVDSASLTVDADGVIRYVLVVETSGGARNVSFEGMRCETRERRIYASGRRDGTWSKSRRNEWVPLRDAVANRQYAALYFDYFCPSGIIANSADTVVRALRSGGYPENRRW